jgi:hypothetical protein
VKCLTGARGARVGALSRDKRCYDKKLFLSIHHRLSLARGSHPQQSPVLGGTCKIPSKIPSKLLEGASKLLEGASKLDGGGGEGLIRAEGARLVRPPERSVKARYL